MDIRWWANIRAATSLAFVSVVIVAKKKIYASTI
jgi:hypothetical protein